MSYEPENWRLREENLSLRRELRAEREAHHAFKISTEKERILKANEHDCDLRHVESLIDGGEPRVDAEGRVVITFGAENHVGTLTDAMQFWRDNPKSYGNIVNIQKPKEASAQDLHNARIAGMPMDKYMKDRKPDGSHLRPPEPPPEQQ